MGLFGSKGFRHLEGHKELTKDKEIISILTGEFMPVKVYFPTMSPNGKPITFTIQPGDKVKVGTKIGQRSDFEVPVYSSVSGTVLANEMILSPAIGRPIAHVVIENDGLYEEDKPLDVVSIDQDNETIFNAVKNVGVEGMGGAGFPSYIKYNNANVETLLVNGVECEPYLTTDYVMMSKNAKDLLMGMEYLMKISHAKEGIIAIKVHKEHVVETIKPLLSEHPSIRLFEVPDAYPMGWERLLIKTVTKKTYNRLPGEVGVIVNNAQSVISIGAALTRGEHIHNRLVTVSGDGVTNPVNVLCPIGTLASDVIKACGGYSQESVNLIPGGPMCGKAARDEKFAITLPIGALTILKFIERKAEPCLRCGMCTSNCPAHLQPVEMKNAYERQDMEALGKLGILDCIECGMCSYICPSKIELTETLRKAKMIYRLKVK